MGGYSGNDPALDGPSLARLVERGEARYVVLGGAYAERGGNAATNAVIAACEVIPAVSWQPRPVNPNALLLYDCAGHEKSLAARADAHSPDGRWASEARTQGAWRATHASD